MYRNLQAEMVRFNIGRKQMATATRIKYSTLSDKLNGKTKFSLDEAVKIKNLFFPNLPLEYLFDNSEKKEVRM